MRVSNDGANWVTIWENPAEMADRGWIYQEFDISGLADDRPAVFLRWTMGASDGGWHYCGWNIDDVQLTSRSCASAPLPGDLDGDGDLDLNDFATFAACYYGAAVTTPPPGCSVEQFADSDLDGDADVDLADFATFAVAFSG